MKTVLHKADTRGYANRGWLDTHHTFSFANYFDPDRIHFGALRVLNDDCVAEGSGFGTHPHENMEIISIPLKGGLEHTDNLGNITRIEQGEIQVLSAGSGISHSEYNLNQNSEAEFLQIWVIPNTMQAEPRYQQISLADIEQENQFYQVLSPSRDDQGVWIHQNAWFSMGNFSHRTKVDYKIHLPDNGIYAFILEGKAKIGSQDLEKRDGFGIWDTGKISVIAEKDTHILLMEVPMNI